MAGANFLLPVSLVFEGDTDGTAARRNPRLLLDLVKYAQLDGRMMKDPIAIPAGRPAVVVLDPAAKDHTAAVKQIVGRIGAGLVQCVVTAPASDVSVNKIPATIAGAKVVKLRLADGGRMLDADVESLRTVKATLCAALPEDHPHRRAFTVPRDLTKEPNPFNRTNSGQTTEASSTRASRSSFGGSRAGSESLHASQHGEPVGASDKGPPVQLQLGDDGLPGASSVPLPPSGSVSAAYVRMVQRRRQRRDIRASGSVSACGSDGALSPHAFDSFTQSQDVLNGLPEEAALEETTQAQATEPPVDKVDAGVTTAPAAAPLDAPDDLSDSATFSTAPCSAATELTRVTTADPEDHPHPTADEPSSSAAAPAEKPRSPTPERARSPSPVSTIAPGDTPRSKHATAGQSPVQQSPVPHVLVDDVEEQSAVPVETPHAPDAGASTAPPTPSLRAPARHNRKSESKDAQEPRVHEATPNEETREDDAVPPPPGGCMQCLCM